MWILFLKHYTEIIRALRMLTLMLQPHIPLRYVTISWWGIIDNLIIIEPFIAFRFNSFSMIGLSLTALIKGVIWMVHHCKNFVIVHFYLNRDSVVGIATGYGLHDRGVRVRVPVGSKIFFSPLRPDRLWDPSSFLSNEYRGLFPWG
jgi:hypothetical protein